MSFTMEQYNEGKTDGTSSYTKTILDISRLNVGPAHPTAP